MTTFGDRVVDACAAKDSAVCVGLDPRPEQLPPEFGADPAAGAASEAQSAAVESFCRQVIGLVAPHAAAIKPQVAFFEALGPSGMISYVRVCLEARRRGLLVIADVKRGDIGTTAEAYAHAWLAPLFAGGPVVSDACTVNAYLGSDGVKPFVDTAVTNGGGVFVLVKTSNPSSGELQDLLLASGEPLYVHVARLVDRWNQPRGGSGYGPVGAVVGATYPRHLAELRALLPGAVILIPGYGAQGAGAEEVVSGFDARGRGALVNASRSITFPWGKREQCPAAWAEAIVAAAMSMKRAINDALAARR